jgi:chaperone modulatory protein CbpM
MPISDADPLSGEIFEEGAELSVADLCRMFAVEERRIVELVEEGVLNVIAIDTREWRFAGASLRRARIALRLERDLGINVPGVALAIELLEEIEQLRREDRERAHRERREHP